MFAIYTPNGRSFYGPLEHLRSIEKPLPSKSTREHQAIDDSYSFGEKDYSVTPKAIDAYKDAINKSQSKEAITHAYQIMSTPVQALAANSSINTAIEQFKAQPFQEFPVIDGKHQLVGMLSREALYRHIILKEGLGNGKGNSIADVFLQSDSKVFSADPVTDIRRIAGVMLDQRVHSIPIVEKTGNIVGIISRTDIIKAVVTEPPLSLWI